MHENFSKYLSAIGVKEEIFQRVEILLSEYELIFPAKIDDIFLTNRLEESGPIYESLWILSGNAASECKNFLSSDRMDFIVISDAVYVELAKQNFNFKDVRENSTLSVVVQFENGMGANMPASGANCIYLLSIAKKYFLHLFH